MAFRAFGGMANLECENLDSMSADELKAHRALAEQSKDRARGKIVAYCNHKILAIAARLAGRIDRASRIEDWCETVYRSLPARLKW